MTEREIVTTVRTSVKDMALLVLYFERHGEVFPSKSQVFQRSVQALVSLVQAKFPELQPDSVTQAVEILKKRGLLQVKAEMKELVKELSLESEQLQLGETAVQEDVANVLALLAGGE